MIGSLLKDLFRVLGRFVGYHTGRILHLPPKPAAAPPPPASTDYSGAFTATEASIGNLIDEVGLSSEYERRIQWPGYRRNMPSQDVASDPLYKLWTTIPGGHKWTHYFPIYEAIFGPLRSEPLRILEIGIWRGASLKLWKRYFEHPKTTLVGVDILPECKQFDAPATGVHVRIGNQADPAFLQRVVKEFGPFDLIIDDGSHHSSHIIASFNALFSEGLKDSGIYFVEDLHANYWHPWRDSKKSFLDVCKELLEHMHAHYKSASPAAFLIDKPFDQPDADLEVPLITTMIEEIRFFDSIVAIYKTHRGYVPCYLRTADQES
jgi:hypothetical protein